MNERDRDLLEGIVEFGERAIRLLHGRDADSLQQDEAAVFALRYCLQTIGEAARALSADAKAEMPMTPWKDIIAMRNRLTHGYATIMDAVVVDTVTLDVPALVHEARGALARA